MKTTDFRSMSTEEAEEVLRLWQEREASAVQVEDLAEALAAPTGEIEGLLAQVRSKNKITVEPVKARSFSALGFGAVTGIVLCALIGAAIVEQMTSNPWNHSQSFFYLFAGLCFVYVPFSTFLLNRQRRKEVDEEASTKQFVFKVQRHRD